MKRLLKRRISSLCCFLQEKGLFAPDRRKGFRILLYHSIDESCGNDYLGIRVAPDNFIKQMEFLKQEGYRVYSLTDLIMFLTENKDFPERAVAITFDDGYKDNLKNAFPVLERLNFYATVFIRAGYLCGQKSKSNKYWEEWDYMTAHDLKGLKSFVDIGSHSLAHRRLTGLSDKEVEEEALRSKHFLEDITGRPVRLFSYPHGAFGRGVKEIVKRAGYHAACSSRYGNNDYKTDLFELKRTEVAAYDNISEFRKKLNGSYDWLTFFDRRG